MKKDIKGQFTPSEFLVQMDLDLNRIYVHPATLQSIEHDFEIKASEFIKFAELDLQQNSGHGLVNALSNAKRAIDCQVDTVLGCFGLLSRKNFPQKMDILRSIGMVTPRIVTKVVKARNYLEHEYKKPEREQVEDAVDVATLFTTLLDKALRNFESEFYIGTVVEGLYDEGDPFQDKWIFVQFDDENIQYELSGVIFDEPPTPESRKAHRIESTFIKPNETGFIELVNLAFSFNEPTTKVDVHNRAVRFIKLYNTSRLE